MERPEPPDGTNRGERYDRIGSDYAATRQEEPRIARIIWEALGDARSVANIGAGTGNYEPRDRDVIAVEPSEVMRAQRPPGAAPAVAGVAERLPFADASVDAVMAVLTDQHWDDCRAGLAEMRRIARRRVVALMIDNRVGDRFWLLRDYLTGYRTLRVGSGPSLAELAADDRTTVRVVPIPWDCRDGFALAFWRRPRAYLSPTVQAGISLFHLLDRVHVDEALERLADDLATRLWRERYGDLLDVDELDAGLRLVVWENK